MHPVCAIHLGDKVFHDCIWRWRRWKKRREETGTFLPEIRRNASRGNGDRIPIVKWICAARRGFCQRFYCTFFRSHFSSNGIAIQGFSLQTDEPWGWFSDVKNFWAFVTKLKEGFFLFRRRTQRMVRTESEGRGNLTKSVFFSHMLRSWALSVITSVIPQLHLKWLFSGMNTVGITR